VITRKRSKAQRFGIGERQVNKTAMGSTRKKSRDRKVASDASHRRKRRTPEEIARDLEDAREAATSSFDAPPSELKHYKIAREEWRRVVPILRRRKNIIRLDRTALIAYCRTYETWANAEEAIRVSGLTMVNKNGYQMHNPNVSISQNALQALMRFWSVFLMTPAARIRTRTKLEDVPDEPASDAITDEEDEAFEKLFLTPTTGTKQ